MNTEYIYLKHKDIPQIREQLLKEQNNKCALCKEPIDENSGASLDHQHRTKSSTLGENGGGLVRGVLCRSCNLFEGRIWRSSKRFGVHDNLSTWLRNLADYLDKENYNMVHPNEVPKEPKLMKSSYNKLQREYNKSERKAKFPLYTGNLTKKLKKLFNDFDIVPKTY